jgi:hypothetical protein
MTAKIVPPGEHLTAIGFEVATRGFDIVDQQLHQQTRAVFLLVDVHGQRSSGNFTDPAFVVDWKTQHVGVERQRVHRIISLHRHAATHFKFHGIAPPG